MNDVIGGPKSVKPRTTLNGEPIPAFGWLRQYVEVASTLVAAPPMWHVACGLAFAAFELSRRGWTIQDGHLTRPALWWGIVANSAENKGRAIGVLRTTVEEYQRRATALIDDPVLGDENIILDFKGTPEGLMAMLEHREYDLNHQKRTVALLVHDEMKEILWRGKKHDYFIGDLIDCWDQRTEVRRHQLNTRKSKQNPDPRRGVLHAPALSTVFVSTAERLTDVLDAELLRGGLASRMLWLSTPANWRDPGQTDMRWYDARVETRQRQALKPVVDALVDWSYQVLEGGFIRYSDQVHEAHMLATYNFKAIRQGSGPTLEAMLARQPTHMLMLAAVFAATDHRTAGPILVGLEHYAAAEQMYAHVEPAIESLIDVAMPTACRALSKHPRGLTTRELSEALQINYIAASREVEALVRHREILGVAMKTGQPGAPPTVYYHRMYAPHVTRILGTRGSMSPDERDNIGRLAQLTLVPPLPNDESEDTM